MKNQIVTLESEITIEGTTYRIDFDCYINTNRHEAIPEYGTLTCFSESEEYDIEEYQETIFDNFQDFN
jgi:hypothetical protein